MSKQQRNRITDLFRRRRDADQAPPPAREPGRRGGRRRDRRSPGERVEAVLAPTVANRPVDGPVDDLLRDVATRLGRQRSRHQRAVLREQREHGNRLRDWLQQRQMAAAKRAKKAKRAAKRAAAGESRGVDRVPERLRDTARSQVWLVRHQPVQHPVTGRWVEGLPYRNPERLERLAKSGRLRAGLPTSDGAVDEAVDKGGRRSS